MRHWEVLSEQERGVDGYLARYARRCLTASRTYDGMVVIEVVLPSEEGEEAMAIIGGQPVDGGSREPGRRRADALMSLLRGTTPAADRYTLHVVADVDALEDRFGEATINGNSISTETLRRLACDCGVVRHVFRGTSEPLDIGRRTSVWTTAQRRAISKRDQRRCRFVACEQLMDCRHRVRENDARKRRP